MVRPVSQVEVSIDAGEGAFEAALDVVLRWLDQRAGQSLPTDAWNGAGFELEVVGSLRTAAISMDSPRYWAARIDDSDKNVAQRNWVTELAIAERADGNVLVGTRLYCVTHGDDIPYEPSVPRFVRTLVEHFPDRICLEGRRLEVKPWMVATESDIYDLCNAIENPERRLDFIVCALPEGSEAPSEATIDVDTVHRATLGTAHVAIVTGPASFALSDRLGKEFSVFRGAVRTYRTGFDTSLDEPFSHPLALPHRIMSWPNGGVAGFERLLVRAALQRSSARRDAQDRLPPFTQAKRIASQLRREVATSSETTDPELLALAEQEIQELRDSAANDRETYEGLVGQYEIDRDQAIEEAEQARNSSHALRARIQMLELQRSEGADAPSIDIPDSLELFEQWTRENLAGAVEIHNRALRGIKASRLEDVSLIYRALLLLRDYYVPMRRSGGLDLKQAFDEQCGTLGIEEEPTFSGNRWGEEGETYRVRFAGRLQLLDRHLKKGNSREERYCFRLYFFWDEDSQQAVVGWLPSHLDTRAT